jgi:uncharacterized protein DUF4386
MYYDVTDISPQRYARIGGLLYLIIIVAGAVGEIFVRGSMIVSGNAAATANNIVASPLWWRVGIAGDLVMHMCDIGVMLVLYVLLRPVSRNLARFALLSNLIQTAVLVANKLTLLIPLFLLGGASYLKAFTLEQLQALSYVALRVHDLGFGVGLIFFGMTCLALGSLIYRSGYLPKVFGILMPIAGAAYLINSFALILAPAFASKLFPLIMLPPFAAETSLAVWLLVKGVNEPMWRARASRL